MFGIADLLTMQVINDGLQFLSKNPTHIEYVLGAFAVEPLRSFVGPEHIKQCVDFIVNNRIHVAPYYQIDIKRRPSVAIVMSGREDQQFLGDYGSNGPRNLPEYRLPPRVYASFEIIGLTNTLDGLVVPAGLKLDTILWQNLIVTNGTASGIVQGVVPGTAPDTQIVLLREPITTPVTLVGWTAQSFPRDKGIVCNASQDLVTIQLTLTTTGDASVHRLLAIIIRYCLKRGRLDFDRLGLQVPTYAYTPLIETDQAENEFESTFTIEARYTDSWIEREFDLNDPTDKISVCVDVVPSDTTGTDQMVQLEEGSSDETNG